MSFPSPHSSLFSSLSFHTTLLLHLPSYALSFLGPFSLPPSLNESIMAVSNSPTASLPSCDYCTVLHGELGRVAGAPAAYMSCASLPALAKLAPLSPALAWERSCLFYARLFAESLGAPTPALGKAQAEMRKRCPGGQAQARSVAALCQFLLWGKATGALIAEVRAAPLKAGPREHLLHALYSPLFAAVTVVGKLLTLVPTDTPGPVMTALSLVLVGVIGTHVVPLGLLGVPFYAASKLM